MWAWTVSLTSTRRTGQDRATGVATGVNAPDPEAAGPPCGPHLAAPGAPADDPDLPGTRVRGADHVARDRKDKRKSQDPLASGDRAIPRWSAESGPLANLRGRCHRRLTALAVGQ